MGGGYKNTMPREEAMRLMRGEGSGPSLAERSDAQRQEIEATMKEAALQTRLHQTARRLGYTQDVYKRGKFSHSIPAFYHTHRSDRSQPGFPDTVLVNQEAGRVLFIELKTEKGELAPEQRAWRDLLLAAIEAGANIEYYLFRPRHLFSGEIEAILAGPMIPERGAYTE